MGGNAAPSIVRTVVPLLVGWLISLPVTAALGLDETTVTGLVTVALSALYYVAVRSLERRWPGVGVLLGSARQPTYVPLPEAKAEPQPEGNTWS